MLSPEKLAPPATAATVLVPDKVPLLGFVPIATVMFPVNPLASGFTGNITVAIGTNPSSGTLSGTKTVAAVAGGASFSGLSIDKGGTGYTLTATGAVRTTRASLNIT